MARAKPAKQKSNNGANVSYEINFNRYVYRYTPPAGGNRGRHRPNAGGGDRKRGQQQMNVGTWL